MTENDDAAALAEADIEQRGSTPTPVATQPALSALARFRRDIGEAEYRKLTDALDEGRRLNSEIARLTALATSGDPEWPDEEIRRLVESMDRP